MLEIENGDIGLNSQVMCATNVMSPHPPSSSSSSSQSFFLTYFTSLLFPWDHRIWMEVDDDKDEDQEMMTLTTRHSANHCSPSESSRVSAVGGGREREREG